MTMELMMIATITFAFDLDDLLDALDLELVEDEEYDYELDCDEDGTTLMKTWTTGLKLMKTVLFGISMQKATSIYTMTL